MNSTLKVSGIVIFGVLVSIALPQVIMSTKTKVLESNKKQATSASTKAETNSGNIVMAEKKDTAVPVAQIPQEEKTIEESAETPQEEVKEEKAEEKQEANVVTAPAQEEQVVSVPEAKPYNEMTTEELIEAINNGSFKLEYSSPYNTNTRKLSKSVGAQSYNGQRETYYSQRVLAGTSLRIPGRHVADDGTVRDGDGYISVAASTSYLPRGAIVKTSLGPAKVYDSGCASGTIDIYTNW